MKTIDVSDHRYLFGIEWESSLEEGILQSLSTFSCVELIPENFAEGMFAESLKALADRNTPVAIHGVHLSIGTMEPLREDHLDRMLEIGSQVNMVSFSEHLSMTEVSGYDLDALTPLAFSQEVMDGVCRKIDAIQKKLKVPFLIENVSNRFYVPGGDFTETEFINQILRKTGCGLLLDVTNVYTNSVNFGFNPYQWIDAVDLSKVQEVHLAGGFFDPEGFLMDTHDNQVSEEAWKLFEYTAPKLPPFMTIVERTSNFPHISTLTQEIERASAIVYGNHAELDRNEVVAQ
jgi:uncharacterized protein (UPF0276 family)